MSNSANFYEFIELFKLNIAVHKLIFVYCFLRSLNTFKKPKTLKAEKSFLGFSGFNHLCFKVSVHGLYCLSLS